MLVVVCGGVLVGVYDCVLYVLLLGLGRGFVLYWSVEGCD